jgi:hypothetical protein
MKFLASILACGLLALAASAQTGSQFGGVTVELTLPQDDYLPGEELRVGVRVLNRSGTELELGKDNTWLRFSIEAKDKKLVPQTGLPPVTGVFQVSNSMQATKWVPVTPYFDLRRLGAYTISAVVEIPGWNRPIKSEPKSFEVEHGDQIRAVEFGVPPPAGGVNAQPEVHHYVLERTDRRGRLNLYLTVSDPVGRAETAFRLCDLLNFSRPEIAVDQNAVAHILSQVGAKEFTYYQVNYLGVILARQTYQYTATRPTLALNKNGEVFVNGGERLVAKTDLPPPELPEYIAPDASSTNL